MSTQINIHQSLAGAGVEELAAVHVSAFEKLDQQGWSAGDIASVLTNAGGFVVVARQAAEVTGFALFRQILDEAELITLAVDPAHQRRGIAQNLLDAAVDYLREQQCASVFLEVREDNIPALTLYERKGFTAVGVRRNYYQTESGARLNALIFRRSLS